MSSPGVLNAPRSPPPPLPPPPPPAPIEVPMEVHFSLQADNTDDVEYEHPIESEQISSTNQINQ